MHAMAYDCSRCHAAPHPPSPATQDGLSPWNPAWRHQDAGPCSSTPARPAPLAILGSPIPISSTSTGRGPPAVLCMCLWDPWPRATL